MGRFTRHLKNWPILKALNSAIIKNLARLKGSKI